ncbi:MAG: glycerol dehydrogenase [Methanobacterium sp.]
MVKIIRTPSRYVQGKDALLEIKEHTSNLGDSLFIITSKTALEVSIEKIEKSYENSGVKIIFEIFNGQSSDQEINRIREIVKSSQSKVIVGVGGGKVLDTARAVAHFEKKPIVIVPTIAATDAPCTAISVIYSDSGVFDRFQVYPSHPDVVIVDSKILTNAPVRFFVAGMGDALATYFEGRACLRSKALNIVGGEITNVGFAIAETCYKLLLEYGYQTKLAVEKGAITEAVENTLEANIYLSGVGAENAGVAGAHSIYNGFTKVEECEEFMHGELVAFGTIVQLVLENSPLYEIEEVIGFSVSVGLPVTLSQINVSNNEQVLEAAKAACKEGELIHNLLGDVTVEDIYDAILAADALEEHYLALENK